MKKKFFPALVFFLLLPWAFYHLRFLLPYGGDYWDILDRVHRSLYYFGQAPLVTAGHHLLWLFLKDWGWTAEQVVAASSSLAGGVFCAGLWRFSKSPKAWCVMTCSSLFMVFLGHVENYAWPYACTLWAFILLKEKLESGESLWSVCAFLAVGTFCHPLVSMAGPGFVWAVYPWSRRTLSEVGMTLLLFLAITDLCLFTWESTGFWQSHWVLSLVHVPGTPGRYTLFSSIHLREWLALVVISIPLSPGILAGFGIGPRSKWKGALLISFGIALVWSFLWEPGLGLLDWDLFAWPGLFLNLLAAEVWTEGKNRVPTPPTNLP